MLEHRDRFPTDDHQLGTYAEDATSSYTASFQLSACVWIRRKLVLTVDSGQGIVIAVPPTLRAPAGLTDRVYDLMEKVITFVSARFKPRGYNERRARGFGKLKAATEKALGNRVNDMLYVEGLGMNPACQGRGYGGALLDAVTSMADASSHASYLYSSNVAANTKFYMSHGYLPVAEILAGDDDPEWDNPPVAVQLMVREVPEGRLETKT
ncbi:hypothetical protein ONZ45_g19279 [Pleurotus djamor]|nr:hypothetical protein ONZ45_g19279 [Pleurotus djamor]